MCIKVLTFCCIVEILDILTIVTLLSALTIQHHLTQTQALLLLPVQCFNTPNAYTHQCSASALHLTMTTLLMLSPITAVLL